MPSKMTKKKSPTHKAAIVEARKAGYDTANYVGQSKDGANVYIASHSTLHYCGLPAFVKVKDGKARMLDFKGAEFDECFELLGICEE